MHFRQYSTAALLGAANVDQNSAVAAASLLMPAAFNPPKVVLEPPPPTPQFADMQLGNSQETSSTPTQVHSEREGSREASSSASKGKFSRKIFECWKVQLYLDATFWQRDFLVDCKRTI